jgi:hypothetical protein
VTLGCWAQPEVALSNWKFNAPNEYDSTTVDITRVNFTNKDQGLMRLEWQNIELTKQDKTRETQFEIKDPSQREERAQIRDKQGVRLAKEV